LVADLLGKRYLIPLLVLSLLISAALGTFFAVSRGQGTPSAPPYVNPTYNYPDIVATVNGDPIGALALARAEALATEAAKTPPPSNLPSPQGDPLDGLIDQMLLAQAADRLGLQPTRAEVEEYAQKEEERLRDLPADQRLQWEAQQRALGLPTENFTDSETLMSVYEQSLKLVNLRRYLREQVAREEGIPVDQVTPPQEGEAMKAFVICERAKADVVVLVPRPTPAPTSTLPASLELLRATATPGPTDAQVCN
jgi:hypothetical protein